MTDADKHARVWIVATVRGWNLVGIVLDPGAEHVTLSPAAVIIEWGTTEGIGQLVAGPTKSTRLGPVIAHGAEGLAINPAHVILRFEADPKRWIPRLREMEGAK